MDASYRSPFGGNSSQAVISSNKDTAVAVPGERNKNWKKIVIFLLIIIVLVAGVAIWFSLRESRRSGIKGEMSELSSLLSWANYSTQCPLVVNDVANLSRTRNEYESALNTCNEKAERVSALMASLKNVGLGGEYDELYRNLEIALSEGAVLGDELKQELNVYGAWHEWKMSLAKMNGSQTIEEIEELVMPLTDVGNTKLSEYAEAWVKKRKALIYALTLFESSGDEVYGTIYSAALADYQELMSKDLDEVVPDLRLGKQTNDNLNLMNAVYHLKEYAEAKL